MSSNRITDLFSIRSPIIQGGMIHVAGSSLVAAVSNAGGLGLLGSGSMDASLLREEIHRTRENTSRPFGVNIPLLYKHSEACAQTCIDEKISIVFTSAGSPKTYTASFKSHGIKVVHVVSTPPLAVKCQEAGVDAIVAEGFEAGGHNGRDELTSLTLIPQVCKAVTIPVIAAGGIITGSQMASAFMLGAEGVQLGTRFLATHESGAHEAFKTLVTQSSSMDTYLMLRTLIPVRLLKNEFAQRIHEAEIRGASKETLLQILGEGRARKGMADGDVHEGELEVSQGIGLIDSIESVEHVVQSVLQEYQDAIKESYWMP